MSFVIASSLLVLVGFCTICGIVLWEMRRADWDKASQASKNIIATIEADIARNIESYDLSLQAVIDGLSLPEINQVRKEVRQLILFDRAATAKHLGAIRVIDASGKTILNSRNLDPQERNRSEHEFFKIHMQNAHVGLYVSRPLIKSDGQHVITISRRLSNADGSFGGIVIGTLQLSYFHNLFRRVSLGADGSVSIMREDGTLVLRSPFRFYDIGRDMRQGEVFKQIGASRSGQFEQTATLDGIKRLFTFIRVGDFPLVVTIGVSVEDIYAGWMQKASIIGIIVLALCGATIGTGQVLARELRLRAEAERALAILAGTDVLTGLCNRRRFDEVIEKELLRSIREKTSLAVLMIDADHFKSHNDTFGHQHGDNVLQAIGKCIASSVRGDTDMAARFGGEEFVVLLPGASHDVAFAVAERIRQKISELESVPLDGPRLPTVSIGVAHKASDLEMRASQLIYAADVALYAAKRNGRNRVEPARVSSPPSLRLVA